MRNASPDASTLAGRAEFMLRLRARGIHSLDVLRALETVPRHLFMPARYAALAARDMALPIACGQTTPRPFVLARMIEALAPAPAHRVLEIGTGSGYATGLLARLAAEAVSLERFRTLASDAAVRLKALGLSADVRWADGLLPQALGRFDRILVDAGVATIPEVWADALEPGGVLVVGQAASAGGAPPRILRMERTSAGGWVETMVVAARLEPLQHGLARHL